MAELADNLPTLGRRLQRWIGMVQIVVSLAVAIALALMFLPTPLKPAFEGPLFMRVYVPLLLSSLALEWVVVVVNGEEPAGKRWSYRLAGLLMIPVYLGSVADALGLPLPRWTVGPGLALALAALFVGAYAIGNWGPIRRPAGQRP